MNGAYSTLAARIRRSVPDVERVVARATTLSEKARTSGDSDYLDGVALNLHGFYAGVERVFEDIARSMERSVPTGPEWHRDLLLQMSAEVASIRPPVISVETSRCLDEYRGFRHVVRNVYTFSLQPARLEALADGLWACYELVAGDLERFCSFLDHVSAVDEAS
jgi:hypothetical protein